MKIIAYKFVEFIPDKENLEDNILYISMDSGTVIHKCFCGCGNEVVTPLSPTDWKLTYNGDSITLYPSIGNWNFDCQSHYWIKNSKIIMANKLSKIQIDSGRQLDKSLKQKYFDRKTAPSISRIQQPGSKSGLRSRLNILWKFFSK